MYFLIDKTSVFFSFNRQCLQKTKAGKAILSDPTAAVFLFLSADEAELIKYFGLLRNATNSPMGLISCRFLLSKRPVLSLRSECLFRILRTVVFLRNEKDLARRFFVFENARSLSKERGRASLQFFSPPRSRLTREEGRIGGRKTGGAAGYAPIPNFLPVRSANAFLCPFPPVSVLFRPRF